MLLRSRRKIQFRAVAVGTARLTFFLTNDRFWTMDVVILGANRYARAGKHEQLGWPPETFFAEYGPWFTKGGGSLGYAKPLFLKGHLTRTHLIQSAADHSIAQRAHQRFVGAVITLCKQWLGSADHPPLADWPQHVRVLRTAMKAFSNQKMDFDRLIKLFVQHFASASPHQRRRTQSFINRAYVHAKRYDDELDTQLPTAYVLLNVQDVEYYNYSDARDIQFNTDKEDAALRIADDLLRGMFIRVNQQRAQFEREGISFYDPNWLATQQARNQPIWYPEQLDQFHLKL